MGAANSWPQDVCKASSESLVFNLSVPSASDDADEGEEKNARLTSFIAALRNREVCEVREPTFDSGRPTAISVSDTFAGSPVL